MNQLDWRKKVAPLVCSASELHALVQERRNVSDAIWLRLATHCKSAFPAAQWPADLGAINSTNIEPVKE